MSSPRIVDRTLLIGILLDLFTAAFCIYVAARVRRATQRGIKLGVTQWFWYGLAAFMLLDGGYAMVVLAREPPVPIPLLVLMARRFMVLVGIAALTVYMFRLAGRSWDAPLWGFYAALITLVEAQTLYENPQSHVVLDWSVQFVYERTTPHLLNFMEGVAIFAPLALGAALALARYGRQPSTAHRFRLVAVTTSILSFCTGIVIGFWNNDWFWYGLFENRLGFSVAAGMLFALRPPFLVRKFWDIPRVTKPEQWPI